MAPSLRSGDNQYTQVDSRPELVPWRVRLHDLYATSDFDGVPEDRRSTHDALHPSATGASVLDASA
jgi:hypothetical protein